jgi:hypothetical protein
MMTIETANTDSALPPCQQGATLGECIDATVAAFMAATPDVPGIILSAQ